MLALFGCPQLPAGARRLPGGDAARRRLGGPGRRCTSCSRCWCTPASSAAGRAGPATAPAPARPRAACCDDAAGVLRHGSGSGGRLEAVSTGTETPPHVLVVDDDRAVRESLRRSLEFNGYDVSLASDGAEALARSPGSAPDALVIDVMMPRLDGIETTRALRTAGNDLPILVLTARDSVGDRVEGLDAGADDYLTKPFALEELLARLRALLRRVHPRGTDDARGGAAGLLRPHPQPGDPRGAPRRPADRADPHRVHAARDVPAPARAGCWTARSSSRRSGATTSRRPRTPSRSTSATCAARPRPRASRG